MAVAGTVTFTETITPHKGGNMKEVKIAWTSDASGNVTEHTTTNFYNGKIKYFVTDPDGTNAPTDNYDIQLLDRNGIDILAGAGANRDTANNEYVLDASVGAIVNSQITVAISNAGNAKSGVILLYIE